MSESEGMDGQRLATSPIVNTSFTFPAYYLMSFSIRSSNALCESAMSGTEKGQNVNLGDLFSQKRVRLHTIGFNLVTRGSPLKHTFCTGSAS